MTTFTADRLRPAIEREMPDVRADLERPVRIMACAARRKPMAAIG